MRCFLALTAIIKIKIILSAFIEIFRENPLIDAKRRRWDESE